MTAAVALDESLGLRRRPDLDVDVGALLAGARAGLIARAYVRPTTSSALGPRHAA